MAKKTLYTIQRFYYEAKALIEKYGIDRPDWRVEVSFDIREREKGLNLTFSIRYGETLSSPSARYNYAYGVTPERCLDDFEETLRQLSGQPLIDRVATEIV